MFLVALGLASWYTCQRTILFESNTIDNYRAILIGPIFSIVC